MKKFALAIFLALTLVSAVVLAEKDYFPIAQQALWDAQKTPISDEASLPEGFKSSIIGCTLLVGSLPSKDLVWSVVKFEVQTTKGLTYSLEVNFTKLVMITIDRQGRTTRNECRLDRGFFTIPHFE